MGFWVPLVSGLVQTHSTPGFALCFLSIFYGDLVMFYGFDSSFYGAFFCFLPIFVYTALLRRPLQSTDKCNGASVAKMSWAR